MGIHFNLLQVLHIFEKLLLMNKSYQLKSCKMQQKVLRVIKTFMAFNNVKLLSIQYGYTF